MKKIRSSRARSARLGRYKSGEYTIKVTFPYDPEDVIAIKEIPGRKWHPEAKVWTVPVSTIAMKALEDLKFDIHPLLRKYYEEEIKDADQLQEINIRGLKKPLYKYQNKGVSFIERNNGRALVADEMGLGKTVQAIAWLQLRARIRPVLIVCPAVVKLNWAREINNFMGFGENQVEIVSGKTPYLLSGDIVIINYDLVDSWLQVLLEYGFKAIILDESQAIKNNKAKRTKAIKKLVKPIAHRICLSGTPIINRPIEFYNTIQLLDRNVFPNWFEFTKRYCDRKHNGFGWTYQGASNTEELNQVLKESIMIRRTKKQVLKDLPDKIRSFFPLEMDPNMISEYEEAENNFIYWMENRMGKAAADRAANAQALTEIEILKQVAVAAKLPNAIDWITDFLDSDEKLVVFYSHRFVGDALMKQFGKVAVKIDGSVTANKRQEAVDRFQQDPKIRLFLGNIKAAGVGITLTASSNVAFLELPWTPGELVQAEDRVHRIGQKAAVNIYYLLAENTVEERIARVLDEKRKVLTSVLDGEAPDENSLIMELIESYSL